MEIMVVRLANMASQGVGCKLIAFVMFLIATCACCGHAQSINNCASKPCGRNSTCIPTALAFTCTCDSAALYYDYTARACKDVNECQNFPCPSNAVGCLNTPNGFKCICASGYTYSDNSCIDVDECNMGTHKCGNATCSNTYGGYQCSCPSGYYYDVTAQACLDVDECAVHNPPCMGSSRCKNSPGSYSCVCPKAGYAYDIATNDCVKLVNPCTSKPCGAAPNQCARSNASVNAYTCTCASPSSLPAWNYIHKPACYNGNFSYTATVGIITNTTTGKCLDIAYNSRYSGTHIWQYDYSAANTAQQFYVTPSYQGNGYYLIRDNSKQYALKSVRDFSYSYWWPYSSWYTDYVKLWSYSLYDAPGSDQLWELTMHPTEQDWLRISSVANPSMCMTVQNDSTSSGTYITLESCTDRSGQWFRLVGQ